MMLLLVVLLTVVVVFAVVCLIELRSWRIDCLMAERERDQLRDHRGDLRRCLAAYERIINITDATVQAIRSQASR